MTTRAAAIAAAALLLVSAWAPGCRRAAPRTTSEEGVPAEAGPLGEAEVLPARCHRADALPLPTGAGVEAGDALVTPAGIAVALVHGSDGGRVASVAWLRSDLTAPRVVDLGPTLGDAPPPRIAWRSGELVAAAYTGGGEARSIALHPVAPAGDRDAKPGIQVPQPRGESLSFDMAVAGNDGLLVWDDVVDGRASPPPDAKASPAARGVVRAAAFTKEQAAPPRDVSPPDSDADRARVVRAGAGFAVLWIASKPEPPALTDAAQVEAPGEARSFGWIEMTTVDAHGVPSGSVRRLTSPSGHVSAYDARPPLEPAPGAPLGQAAADAALLIVARDDGEASDGSGGSLLRVRVRGGSGAPGGEGNDVEVVPLVTAGLGRGAPSVIADALFWVGKDEQARLMAVGATTGAGVGAEGKAQPSLEEGLNDAQPLVFLGPTTMLAATPSDPAGPLRVFTCVSRIGLP